MKSESVPLIKGQFAKDSQKLFAFQIPANILADIQNVDNGEMNAIVESVTNCWERAHKEWEAAKNEPIRQILEADRKFNPSIPESCSSDDFVDELLKAGERQSDRGIKHTVLQLIKSSYFRTLNSPDIMPFITSAVEMAVKDNDHEFFKRLGRELERPAMPYKPPKEQTPLERLLITHWFTPGQMGLHFCCFTDEALADFLHCVAPESGPTLDAVRKTRQRLKLKQTERKLVKTIECKGDCIVLG